MKIYDPCFGFGRAAAVAAAMFLALPAVGDVVFDVSRGGDVRELVRGLGAAAPAVAGRGGLSVIDAEGDDGEAALKVGGRVDGSLYPDAKIGDLLLPGSGFHGLAVPEAALGKPCVFSYEIYLAAGHGVTFNNAQLRLLADAGGDQIVGFGDGGQADEFSQSVVLVATGADLGVTGAWQRVEHRAVLPARDKAGAAIAQAQVHINFGSLPGAVPSAEVKVRNVRLEVEADDAGAAEPE